MSTSDIAPTLAATQDGVYARPRPSESVSPSTGHSLAVAVLVVTYVSYTRFTNHGLFWGTALRSWGTVALAASGWLEYRFMQALFKVLLD